MTDRLDFETRLEQRLRARAAVASRPFDAAAIARQVVAVSGPRRRIGRLEWPSTRSGFAWLVVALLLAIALLGAVALVGALLRERPPLPSSVVSDGWIAYGTSGHGPRPATIDLPPGYNLTTGSDLYLVRPGVEPRLIAGREGGKIWNECPAFSPDGRWLAYGVGGDRALGTGALVDADPDRALVVLGVDDNGVIGETTRFPVPGAGSPVCPRWSSDGTRVAYLDGGTVVVRGLDGSKPPIAAGDPHVEDFGSVGQSRDPLLSPTGDRMIRQGSDGLVVARPDGTADHVIPLSFVPYAIPAWSPDGRQVLLMKDVSGRDFTMYAIAVDPPFDLVTIASTVPTNGTRSWPAWGDVSWQPVLR